MASGVSRTVTVRLKADPTYEVTNQNLIRAENCSCRADRADTGRPKSGEPTVPTFAGAKTITVDSKTHNAYLFQPERGPAPPPPADAPPPEPGRGRGRGPQGPIVAAWFIVIKS